jgi:hypothetical protein
MDGRSQGTSKGENRKTAAQTKQELGLGFGSGEALCTVARYINGWREASRSWIR